MLPATLFIFGYPAIVCSKSAALVSVWWFRQQLFKFHPLLWSQCFLVQQTMGVPEWWQWKKTASRVHDLSVSSVPEEWICIATTRHVFTCVYENICSGINTSYGCGHGVEAEKSTSIKSLRINLNSITLLSPFTVSLMRTCFLSKARMWKVLYRKSNFSASDDGKCGDIHFAVGTLSFQWVISRQKTEQCWKIPVERVFHDAHEVKVS